LLSFLRANGSKTTAIGKIETQPSQIARRRLPNSEECTLKQGLRSQLPNRPERVQISKLLSANRIKLKAR